MLLTADNDDSSARSVARWAVLLMVALTILFFVHGFYFPVPFSSDSWTNLELSGSVFHDFGRYQTLRQAEFHSPYTNSFPPLWPCLIAVVRQIHDIGIYAGIVLNFLICMATLTALVALSRRSNMPATIGCATYAALLSSSDYMTSALSNTNFPLSVLLLLVALLLLMPTKPTALRFSGAGLAMGLNCLNRFDMFAAAFVFGAIATVVAWWRERRGGERVDGRGVPLVAYYAALVIALSPWIAYNLHHFGTPFASDNTRQVLRAEKGRVMDYFKEPPESDLIHHPWRWSVGFATQKVPRVLTGFVTFHLKSSLMILVAVAVAVGMRGATEPISVERRRLILLASLLLPFLIVPHFLVGWGFERYFVPSLAVATVALLAFLYPSTRDLWRQKRVLLLLVILAVSPSGWADAKEFLSFVFGRGGKSSLVHLKPTPEMTAITGAISQDSHGNPHRVLFMSMREGGFPAAEYGALTGDATSLMPTILTGTLADFVRDWQITHVYDPEDCRRTLNTDGIEFTPLSVPGLFRVHVRPSRQRPS